MPEISASDLRRLRGLESRLEKARDERSTLAAESKELRRAVADSAKRARAAEKAAEDASSQVDAVVAENRTLAARLEEAERDREGLSTATAELREALDAARAELDGARKEIAAAREELSAAGREHERLTESLAAANEQLAGKAIAPVLPALEVARLVDDLVVNLGGRLPGVKIRDGEMKLNVAFGKVGEERGFVVPSAESPPEIRENLHEVTLRFDRPSEPPHSPR